MGSPDLPARGVTEILVGVPRATVQTAMEVLMQKGPPQEQRARRLGSDVWLACRDAGGDAASSARRLASRRRFSRGSQAQGFERPSADLRNKSWRGPSARSGASRASSTRRGVPRSSRESRRKRRAPGRPTASPGCCRRNCVEEQGDREGEEEATTPL